MEIGHRIKSYLEYLGKGKSGYYLHSPFLFNFDKNILRDKAEKPTYCIPEKIFRDYLRDFSVIELGRQGAKNYTKGTVNEIASNHSVPRKYGRLLTRLAGTLNKANIIELGTALGVSTAYLAVADPSNHVITFEGENKLSALAQQSMSKSGIHNIAVIKGNIDESLPVYLKSLDKFRLAFVDANHTYEATIKYFNWLLPYVDKESIIVFDDIHWSQGMSQAWAQIIKSSAVTLSIDLYRIGIIFFNADLSKENFRIWF